MKTILIFFAVLNIYCAQSEAFMPLTQEFTHPYSNESENGATVNGFIGTATLPLCSMGEAETEAQKKIVKFIVKKDKSVIYSTNSAAQAATKLALLGHHLCQIKVKNCFLVKVQETGEEAILMDKKILLYSEDSQAFLISLQKENVCTPNGIIEGDYSLGEQKLTNTSVRYTVKEMKKYFQVVK